jgi:arylsulfatase A-like enzyme
VTLAEMFKSNGYATAAIISADVLNPVFGMNQGFDLYSGNFIGAYDDKGQTDAVDATERAVDWLKKMGSDEPVFLFVHYYDPHPPFRAPSRFSFGHPYDAEVAFVDEQIGELLSVLKNSGRYQDAIIVITSDHGESLGERGILGHTLVLFEEALHVPLIVRFPAAENAGREVRTLTRSIDLMPTILGRVRIPLVSKIDGIDLAKSISGQQNLGSIGSYADTLYMGFPYLHQRSVIRNGWKTISLFNLPPDFNTEERHRSGALLAMLQAEVPEHLVTNCVQIMLNIPDGRVLFNLNRDNDEHYNLNRVKPLLADDMERSLIPGITYHPNNNLVTILKKLGYVQ